MREPEYGGGSCVPPKDDPRRVTKRASALDLAFDAATGQLLVVAQQRAPVLGRLLRLDPATGATLGTDIETGDTPFAVVAVAVSADGTRLAVAETDLARYRKGRVRLFELGPDGAGRDPVTLDIADLRPVTRLAFAADGRTLAGASDRLAVVWHLPAGGTPDAPSRGVLSGHDGTITDLAFDTAGRFLYTTSSDETVRVWSLATEETIHTISPLYGTIQAIALADGGTRIIVGGNATAAVLGIRRCRTGPHRSLRRHRRPQHAQRPRGVPHPRAHRRGRHRLAELLPDRHARRPHGAHRVSAGKPVRRPPGRGG